MQYGTGSSSCSDQPTDPANEDSWSGPQLKLLIYLVDLLGKGLPASVGGGVIAPLRYCSELFIKSFDSTAGLCLGLQTSLPHERHHAMDELEGAISAPRNRNDLIWRKSSFSNTGACVEIAHWRSLVLVRDTKDRTGPLLEFTESEWAAFLSGVRDGQFDKL